MFYSFILQLFCIAFMLVSAVFSCLLKWYEVQYLQQIPDQRYHHGDCVPDFILLHIQNHRIWVYGRGSSPSPRILQSWHGYMKQKIRFYVYFIVKTRRLRLQIIFMDDHIPQRPFRSLSTVCGLPWKLL